MPDEIFDADALLADMRATARPFKLGGETFHLLPPTAWPDEVMALATDDVRGQDVVTLARKVLGDEYDRFVAVGGSAMLLQTIVEKVFGGSLGESSASSPSSNRAARRSKPTSSATTTSTSSTLARNGSPIVVPER